MKNLLLIITQDYGYNDVTRRGYFTRMMGSVRNALSYIQYKTRWDILLSFDGEGMFSLDFEFYKGILSKENNDEITKLGCNNHIISSLNKAFLYGYDNVFVLEDDLIVSPDVLAFIDNVWLKTDYSEENNILCLFNTITRNNFNHLDYLLWDMDKLLEGRSLDFNPWGWVIGRDLWCYEKFRRELRYYSEILSNMSWDHWMVSAIKALVKEQHECVNICFPKISRTRNIGVLGQHHHKNNHREQFTDPITKWYDPSPEGDVVWLSKFE